MEQRKLIEEVEKWPRIVRWWYTDKSGNLKASFRSSKEEIDWGRLEAAPGGRGAPVGMWVPGMGDQGSLQRFIQGTEVQLL